jgi:hypothetical protein
MTPAELAADWQQTQRQMQEYAVTRPKTLGEIFAEITAELFALLMRLLLGLPPEEEKENSTRTT